MAIKECTEKRYASLGDSITSSTGIRFSVHTSAETVLSFTLLRSWISGRSGCAVPLVPLF
jgi:hypothetical protein